MFQYRHGLQAALHSKRTDFKTDCNKVVSSNLKNKKKFNSLPSSHLFKPDISERAVGGSSTALFLMKNDREDVGG